MPPGVHDVIRKERLLLPGPTPVLPAAAQAALAATWPGMNHRGPEFRGILLEVRRGLQGFFRTRNDVLLLGSSGTGAMEACIVNALEPGDHALVVVGGRFGERWAAIARAHGVEVHEFRVAPGESPDPAALGQAIAAQAETLRAVILCAVETGTGALMDPTGAAEAVRTLADCLLIVDGITWLGAHLCDPDVLGIDLLVCASQKALACPPGVAMVAVSPRAMARAESLERGRFYFDLIREQEGQRDGLTAFTPALPQIAALRAALQWIDNIHGGVRGLCQNAGKLAAATRAGLVALECEVYPKVPANSLTAVRQPEGLSSTHIVRDLQTRFGWTISDGQGALRGKVLRIGHLGFVDEADVLGVIGALEIVLLDKGLRIRPGQGLAAAQEVLAHLSRVESGQDLETSLTSLNKQAVDQP
jgi:aspartate aminotransferase-like enzyme